MPTTDLLLAGTTLSTDAVRSEGDIASIVLDTDGRQKVSNKPVTPSAYNLTSTASTNASSIKTSPGSLYEISVFNPTAAVIYLKLYNKTTTPTVGTDVPLAVIPVPVNGQVTIEYGVGKRFSNGIALATTLGPLSTDVAAIAVGALISASYL